MDAGLIRSVRQIARDPKGWPGIIHLRRARYERLFPRATWNAFKGVFGTYEEALQAVPKQALVGYDNDASARMYYERTNKFFAHDYPVLYWLRPLLRENLSIFDIGGHVGVGFYGYQRQVAYPAGLCWTVCDVPAVCEVGEALARAKGATGIRFTSSQSGMDGSDVVLASGSLQYIASPRLADTVGACKKPPRHILVNMLPTRAGKTFFTLNNIGAAICPYMVVNEKEFVESLTCLGYELVDAWDNPEKSCFIPFHPEHSVHGYRGFYFQKALAS